MQNKKKLSLVFCLVALLVVGMLCLSERQGDRQQSRWPREGAGPRRGVRGPRA